MLPSRLCVRRLGLYAPGGWMFGAVGILERLFLVGAGA